MLLRWLPALGLAGGWQVPVAAGAARARREAGRRAALAVLDDAISHCPPDARLHHERAQLHLLLRDRKAFLELRPTGALLLHCPLELRDLLRPRLDLGLALHEQLA